MNAKTVQVFFDKDVYCSLFFTEKVRRIDIRQKEKGHWTKKGVSLTASEFKHCLDFANNFEIEGEKSEFFNVMITKDKDQSFKIMKNGKGLLTTCYFWKEMEPLTSALLYLISEPELPLMVLLDLYILARYHPEPCCMDLDSWKNNSVLQGRAWSSYLTTLGLFEPTQPEMRRFDPVELRKFADEDNNRFKSFIRLMHSYLYKEDAKEWQKPL